MNTSFSASFAVVGALESLDDATRERLVARSTSSDAEVRAAVARAIERVRTDGDTALRDFARDHDRVLLEAIEVPRAVRRAALERMEPGLRSALERAARNIESAHTAMTPRSVEVETEPGVVIGRRPDALARVGIYAPGGTALYPSSVLMGVVPARVAGVPEVVLCSPPTASGVPSDVVLAAAEIAGVGRVFAAGGAGAIAAMAFGTHTIPQVDRIVGPGGAWVAEAKLQLAGQVSFDAPAGPSELLAIVAPGEDLATVAAEVIAQAEHDARAAIAVIVVGEATAARATVAQLGEAIRDAVASAPRSDFISRALAARGALLWTESRADALAFAARYAPEHLLLAVPEPETWLPSVRNTGAVYLGTHASPVFGDYMTGANHTLPTGGTARSWSGLSTSDFVRWTTWQRISPPAAAGMAGDVARLADAEGLPGHAAAARRAGRVADALSARGSNGTRPLSPIDLSDNTNRFGTPPAARMLALLHEDVASYPSPDAEPLRAAIADLHAVTPDQVVTGSGSGEVIECALRAFAQPGDRLVFPAPTFSMLPAYASHQRMIAIPVPFLASGDFDVEALLAERPDVLYLCAPNNPTGHLPAGDLARLIDGGARLVIVDEAYAEFAGRMQAQAPRDPRVLVTRTLSKAYGLAGLRVGYGIGHETLIARLARMRGPFRVGRLPERVATEVLRHDRDWVARRVRDAIAERDAFSRALCRAGFQPWPSCANFVLVPVADADDVARRMAERGVRVRAFANLVGIGDAVRITVGPRSEMERALSALAACASAVGPEVLA